MYEGVKISVRSSAGDTEYSLMNIRLNQGLSLSPFLFNIIMDEFIREFRMRALGAYCLLMILSLSIEPEVD